jgi:hypothetical protein
MSADRFLACKELKNKNQNTSGTVPWNAWAIREQGLSLGTNHVMGDETWT